MECLSLQGLAKRLSPVLVYFVPALAYHFCLALPAVFTQPGAHFRAEPCKDFLSLPTTVATDLFNSVLTATGLSAEVAAEAAAAEDILPEPSPSVIFSPFQASLRSIHHLESGSILL